MAHNHTTALEVFGSTQCVKGNIVYTNQSMSYYAIRRTVKVKLRKGNILALCTANLRTLARFI